MLDKDVYNPVQRLRTKYQELVANPTNMIWFSKYLSMLQESEIEISDESEDEFSEIFLKNVKIFHYDLYNPLNVSWLSLLID